EKFNRGISSGSQTNFTDISSNYNITNNIPNQTSYLVPSDKDDSIFISKGQDIFTVPFENNFAPENTPGGDPGGTSGHTYINVGGLGMENFTEETENKHIYAHLWDNENRPPSPIRAENPLYNKLDRGANEERYSQLDPRTSRPIQAKSQYNTLNRGTMTSRSDPRQRSASDTVNNKAARSNQPSPERRENVSAVYGRAGPPR
ncbi:MAG: hypothetical protein VXW87_04635, partial [Pseudomonadota bacterium]|nr:hypothetical protein [Pseudomonadota bacterium]